MATAAPQRPAGPSGAPLVGHMLEYYRDPLGFLTRLAREYGDVAHFKLGPQDAYLLNHPDYVKEVLVTQNANFVKGRAMQQAKRVLGEGLLTSEGAFHRRQRRLAQPAFHQQRVAAYAAIMTDYGREWRERWTDGTTVDVAHEMMGVTLPIVAKTLFGADLASEAQEVAAALTECMVYLTMIMLPFVDVVTKLPLPSTRRAQQAHQRLDATIYRIIEQRRASAADRADLLSLLLQARDEEGDGTGMTDQQLHDEVITVFLTGHETVAVALTWTWYLLAQHPEVEARLHAEVDSVLGGRLPTVEDLPRLSYARMVLSEVMRLYPPAWGVSRRALSDFQVGPYRVPGGAIVVLSQYLLHRDGRYFPEPERFDPERWAPGVQDGRPRYAYFPFGGGPRQCIGEPFAWMEATLLLATFAQQWRMRLVPGHPVELQPLVSLRPRHGIQVTLERR